MYNLLPQQNSKNLKSQYVVRLIDIVLGFILVSALILFILLLPSYFVSASKEKIIGARKLDIENSDVVQKQKQFADLLSDAKNKASILAGFAGQTNIYQIIDQIIFYKTAGTGLKSFSIYTQEGVRHVKIEGVASNRDSLLSFSKSLKREKMFSSVDTPVSNFEKESNIDFNISFILNK